MGDAILWWLTIQLLALVVLPIAAVLFRTLPDRGYASAKMLGVLLVGWLAYTISMAQLAPFGRLLMVVSMLLVGAFSAFLLLRNGRALLGDLRDRFRTPAFLRYVLAAELLFSLAYVVWTIVRAYNPTIVDQEKFMDFGFLNAILKSGTLPPNDMWLAGHSINYYYFGYILVAGVTALSGVPTEVAFNLTISSFFALTALGAFGVVYNLAASRLLRREGRPRRRIQHREQEAAPAPPRRRQVAAAVPTATVEQTIPTRRKRTSEEALQAESSVATVEADSVEVEEAPVRRDGRARGDGARPNLPPAQTAPHEAEQESARIENVPRTPFFLSPYIYAVVAALMLVAMGNLTTTFARHDGDPMEGNGWRFCFIENGQLCNNADNFDWWAPSRIIQDYVTVNGAKQKAAPYETINEFPAFSFVLGDMHPHLMALPLVLLTISTAHAFSRRRPPRSTRWLDGLPRGMGWAVPALAGIIAGSLYTTNTWDFPTYLLVLLACLALPFIAVARRMQAGWRWLRPWLVQAALLVAFSLLAYLPFHLTFKSLVGARQVQLPENLANIPLLGWVLQKLGTLVLINTADKTILGFLVIFGIFLFAIVAWVLYEFAASIRRQAHAANDGDRWRRNTLVTFGAGFAFVLLIAVVFRFPLLALLLPMIVLTMYMMWREPGRIERNVALALLAIGALIGLTVEMVFLRDNFEMRMNTLFKFYYQIWVLWALAAGYGFWRAMYAAFHRRDESVGRGRVAVHTASPAWKWLAGAWAVAFVLLVLSGLLYSYYGVMRRQVGDQTAMRGLDGMTWMRDISPGDYEAIRWLKENGRGDQIVLEAGRDEYMRPGRVSAYTGVPTLVAWDVSHEMLWRTNQPELLSQINERRQVVNSIYQGVDPQTGAPITAERLVELLRQYGVTYVFAGDTERGVPGAAPGQPTEQMTPYAEAVFKQTMPEAFRSGNTVIYEVRDSVAGSGTAPPTPAPGAGTTPTADAGAQPDPNVPPRGLFEPGPPGVNRGQLHLPRGIARDPQGNFYVVDTQNMRVQKFDAEGNWLLSFGGKGFDDGQLAPMNDEATGTGPGGIALDAQGNVYVADTWNHRIQKFDGDGAFLGAWGSYVNLSDPAAQSDPDRDSRFFGPRGVAVGPDGHIYVTDTGNKRVLIFNSNGEYQRQISSGMSPQRFAPEYPFTQPGELNEPIGVAVDGAGNVYVADTNNRRIQKFDSEGKFVAQWAVPEGSWEPGPYLEPFLSLDGEGNVYATAPTGKTVLKFNPDGELVAQKNSSESATLVLPTGITVDEEGNVYVVDTQANTVINLGPIR